MISELRHYCSTCEKELYYSNKGKLVRAIRDNCRCRSCSKKGIIFSDDHKQKLSKSKVGKPSLLKGRPLTEEHKKKISISRNGIFPSLISIQKMSIAKRGCKAWNKGIRYSEDARAKMSERAKIIMPVPSIETQNNIAGVQKLCTQEQRRVYVDGLLLEAVRRESGSSVKK